MRKTYAKKPIHCTRCPRTTLEPRRNSCGETVCFNCYQRERRGAVLELGATCSQCGEDDPLVLRVTPFGVLCANDHARARAAAVA
jgi:hypothetical protein